MQSAVMQIPNGNKVLEATRRCGWIPFQEISAAGSSRRRGFASQTLHKKEELLSKRKWVTQAFFERVVHALAA